MLEQLFKSQIATVSDPYQCNCITDALAAAGIKFYCKTKDANRRNAFDQARIGTLGIKPKYITEVFVDKENTYRTHLAQSREFLKKLLTVPLGVGLSY